MKKYELIFDVTGKANLSLRQVETLIETELKEFRPRMLCISNIEVDDANRKSVLFGLMDSCKFSYPDLLKKLDTIETIKICQFKTIDSCKPTKQESAEIVRNRILEEAANKENCKDFVEKHGLKKAKELAAIISTMEEEEVNEDDDWHDDSWPDEDHDKA